jgi:hypothetical protein
VKSDVCDIVDRELYQREIFRFFLISLNLIVLVSNDMCKVFEIRVLRTFGSKGSDVTGYWRKLRNEDLNAMYSSPNIIRVIKSRKIKCFGHVARMGEMRVMYRILVVKPEGRRSIGRPRCGVEE